MIDFFVVNKFNQKQLEAISILEGPLLILAGAGTGKTRVIINRIEKIINQGVPANKIVATTFKQREKTCGTR